MSNWSFSGASYGQANSNQFGGEDEDDLGGKKFENMRDQTLFIVDCSERMWKSDGGDQPAVLEVLRTIVDVCRLNAVMGSKDFFGLLLYGVNDPEKIAKSNTFGGGLLNNSDKNNFKIMQELGQTNAETILELMRLIEGGKALFQKELGIASDADLKMNLVLWEALRMFQHKKFLGSKRMVLLTNNDNPHSTIEETKIRSATARRFGDVNNNNILFEVFGLPCAGQEFDFSKFYANLLPDKSGDGDDEQHSFQAYQTSLEVSQALRKKQFSKRSLAKTHLKLADGVVIAVSLYSMLLEAKKPAFKLADAVSLQKVETAAKYVRQDNQTEVHVKRAADSKEKEKEEKAKAGSSTESKETAETVEEQTTQTKFGFPYGGEKIVFEEEEIMNIKGLFAEGIELLGFKPQSFLKPYYSIRAPYFLYPDENRLIGSTTVFSALLEQMFKKNVVALCRFQPRKGTMSRLAVLYPQLEKLDAAGAQEKPPGFHVFMLPYADDLRQIKLPDTVDTVSYPQVESFKKIIEKFQLTDYHPGNYRNPILQSYYSVIEALALNLEEAEQWQDTIQPPIARLEKYKSLFDELTSALPDEPEPESKPKGRKKATGETKPAAKKRVKANSSDSEANDPPKKAKRAPAKATGKKKSKHTDYGSDSDNIAMMGDSDEESAVESVDMEFWKSLLEKGKVSKMTVAELKDFLKSQGLAATGKKADLVSRAEEHLSNL